MGPLFLTNCEYECPEEVGAGAGRLRARGRGRYEPPEVPEDEDARSATTIAMPGEPPHICVPDLSSGQGSQALGQAARMCHVFTGSGAGITVNASLLQATNPDADQTQWCNYPIGNGRDG